MAPPRLRRGRRRNGPSWAIAKLADRVERMGTVLTRNYPIAMPTGDGRKISIRSKGSAPGGDRRPEMHGNAGKGWRPALAVMVDPRLRNRPNLARLGKAAINQRATSGQVAGPGIVPLPRSLFL